ncbi:hypothetical protein HYZ64_00630 [Candidatus Berkelbacteria bacterium]|nr:hypothetical protein [Candidatus Berkelbacteria bacterium]
MYIVATISKNSYPAEKVEAIILAGANGIMLTKETGISKTPGRSVEVAAKIIRIVNRSKK